MCYSSMKSIVLIRWSKNICNPRQRKTTESILCSTVVPLRDPFQISLNPFNLDWCNARVAVCSPVLQNIWYTVRLEYYDAKLLTSIIKRSAGILATTGNKWQSFSKLRDGSRAHHVSPITSSSHRTLLRSKVMAESPLPTMALDAVDVPISMVWMIWTTGSWVQSSKI